MTRNHEVGMLAMFVASSLIGLVAALGDNMAFATKKHIITNAEQIIEQKLSEYEKYNSNDANQPPLLEAILAWARR
jgi:hypothetical protein